MKLRIGVGIANLPAASPRGFFDWVELCERSDVDSIWQTDRLVSPQPFLESLSVMAALAGATERLKFGMNAVVAPLRDPLVLAKQCATIDWLSGGRLLPVFGVGGEKAPEFRATGRDPAERGERADEVLELARRLWSEESVTFHGQFHHYEGVSISPRPVQQPLPLWIGGSSPAADAAHREARHGLARRRADTRAGRARDRGHSKARRGVGPADPRGPLRRELRVPARARRRVTRVARLHRARPRRRRRTSTPRSTSRWARPEAVLERIAQYRAVGRVEVRADPARAERERSCSSQTRRLAGEVLPESLTAGTDPSSVALARVGGQRRDRVVHEVDRDRAAAPGNRLEL